MELSGQCRWSASELNQSPHSQCRASRSRQLIAKNIRLHRCRKDTYSGHRAIASFASKLTQQQRRRLRCYRNKHTGQYQVPGETCIRQILYKLDAEACENVIVQWMAGLDESELRYIAIDGKTLKGTARRDEHGEKKGALQLPVGG